MQFTCAMQAFCSVDTCKCYTQYVIQVGVVFGSELTNKV